jgi:hypothetical protein
MVAKYLWEAGSIIITAMASGHLYSTFFTNAFSSRNTQVIQEMKTSHPILTNDLNMWDSWISFNATHSSGGMFIGLVNFYLAYNYFEIFGADHLYLIFNIITIGFYVWLAWKYWFRPIQIGLTLVLLCYLSAYLIIIF